MVRAASLDDRARAAELIARQLDEASRRRTSHAKPSRFRVRSDIYRAAEMFFEANGMDFGPRPAWIDNRIIRTLTGLRLLERSGRSSGTQYRLIVHPSDLARSADVLGVRVASQKPVPQPPPSAVVNLNEDDREYLRAHVRAYLDLSASLSAAKISPAIARSLEARAREILAAACETSGGPQVTLHQARSIAHQEAIIDLETRLRREFRPVMFELFGGVDTATPVGIPA